MKNIRFDTFASYVPGFIIDGFYNYKDINTILKDSIKDLYLLYWLWWLTEQKNMQKLIKLDELK